MGDTNLRRLGAHTWFAELNQLRIEPRADLVQLATWHSFDADGCHALVTDRCRLELLRVSIEGRARWPIVLELRSGILRSNPWPVIRGTVSATVESGYLC